MDRMLRIECMMRGCRCALNRRGGYVSKVNAAEDVNALFNSVYDQERHVSLLTVWLSIELLPRMLEQKGEGATNLLVMPRMQTRD